MENMLLIESCPGYCVTRESANRDNILNSFFSGTVEQGKQGHKNYNKFCFRTAWHCGHDGKTQGLF